MRACKTGAPEGEAPPTHCPICLDAWDAQERLPKFLSCHHSVCVSCVDLLYQAALTQAPPTSPGSPPTPTSPLGRFMGSRSSLNGVLEPEEQGGSSWVKCPLCRSSTLIHDPHTLQTNFYLRGLLRAPSVPRLVLWCDTCSTVAAPSCAHHHHRPLQDKMCLLQEELVAAAGEACGWACGRVAEYESQVEVYRWVCRLLRHAHTQVLTTLTHVQHQHRALNRYNKEVLALVNRGEVLQGSQELEEEAINGLETVVQEVKDKHEEKIADDDPLTLTDTFHLSANHRGPQGYHRALLVLEADEALTLSIYGEKEREKRDVEDTNDEERDTEQKRRFYSLQENRRKEFSPKAKMKVTRSFSLHEPSDGVLLVPDRAEKETPAVSQHLVQPSPSRPKPNTRVRETNNIYEPEDPISEPFTQVTASHSFTMPKKPPVEAPPSRDNKRVANPSPVNSNTNQTTVDARDRRIGDGNGRHQRRNRQAEPTPRDHQRQRPQRRRKGKSGCSVM
ncbi:uncharacterized protein LOC121853177 [Homarus americanus]|uniref:Putative Zinc finger, C3HC4 type (RING finger)-containing protein n=1 Tax=Homarus americanus TaxID=6706 RepID=A0A8J5JPL6_HOMAM|nr:uncharacterized protein LOC121853177 [Homarus americanus]XP_042203078.1 uncharacterized protein LOC121853177 [Homarus americanus]XP_042203079.1 uncharacterized protein LOC121853177 [Homarus americanus]KAG7156924.1 putative Zinc finger, C3HC4 type (RING finger)-containing protein [Homarus americanus]